MVPAITFWHPDHFLAVIEVMAKLFGGVAEKCAGLFINDGPALTLMDKCLDVAASNSKMYSCGKELRKVPQGPARRREVDDITILVVTFRWKLFPPFPFLLFMFTLCFLCTVLFQFHRFYRFFVLFFEIEASQMQFQIKFYCSTLDCHLIAFL